MKALLADTRAQAGASGAAAASSRSERLAAAAVAALLGNRRALGRRFFARSGMAQRGARYPPLDGVSLSLTLGTSRKMPFLWRVLLAALFAGVLSGAFAAALHQLATVPLILEAEKYEHAPPRMPRRGARACRHASASLGIPMTMPGRPRRVSSALRTRSPPICWRASASRCCLLPAWPCAAKRSHGARGCFGGWPGFSRSRSRPGWGCRPIFPATSPARCSPGSSGGPQPPE